MKLTPKLNKNKVKIGIDQLKKPVDVNWKEVKPK